MVFKRSERVGDLLKREIGDIIGKELKDPRVGFATIISVDVSADLRHARVFFSVFGDRRVQEETQSGLDSARFFIQGEIGRRLRLKYTPELSFQFDRSIEYGFHISKLLKRVQKEDEG
ncbi:30S ribosome-binding factor RbfA [bacterium]|nr:30S ribosome-binding factor RbfA [bacterium]MCK4597265.1 30S ribosome-binding factor RbfA [bacterium]